MVMAKVQYLKPVGKKSLKENFLWNNYYIYLFCMMH